MTLTQEAASLHLVLEMRNQEVRSLREKAASLEHRLEKFENVQVKGVWRLSV
jgi:ubiquinone biosynthesis protein UbiJ